MAKRDELRQLQLKGGSFTPTMKILDPNLRGNRHDENPTTPRSLKTRKFPPVSVTVAPPTPRLPFSILERPPKLPPPSYPLPSIPTLPLAFKLRLESKQTTDEPQPPKSRNSSLDSSPSSSSSSYSKKDCSNIHSYDSSSSSLRSIYYIQSTTYSTIQTSALENKEERFSNRRARLYVPNFTRAIPDVPKSPSDLGWCPKSDDPDNEDLKDLFSSLDDGFTYVDLFA